MNIRSVRREDALTFNHHVLRHRLESGRDGDDHFMPFAPNEDDGPRGIDMVALLKPLDQPGWQRCFVALHGQEIVGHVDLKAAELRVGLHRCELGIGVERPHRGAGLGRALMQTAIEFARKQMSLEWIDLRTFGHNKPAQALYQQLGFKQIGVIEDCFRIDGQIIDDVLMSLKLRGQ